MQIFATSPDPMQCARWLDNKRLNKMVTETAQIICTILNDDGVKGLPFKPTHAHHPAVKWAGQTDNNLWWLAQHHTSLHGEWTHRFGKIHASGLSGEQLHTVRMAKAPKTFHNGAKNDSLELDFTWIDDTHLAYRMYLTARWLKSGSKPIWTKRATPIWFEQFPFEDAPTFRLLIGRSKEIIGKKHDGSTHCPRCGSILMYHDATHFECTGSNECLSWQEIQR